MFLRNHSIKSRECHVIKGSWAAPSVNRFLLTLSETNGHVSHAIYLETVWKKAHLCGSDLREALIEVANLFVSSPETGDATAVRKYVMCLAQISMILYSLDTSRSPKQCLQFYNCAFTVHKLHLELFGTAVATQYFHALLLHGPQRMWLHSAFMLCCCMVHSACGYTVLSCSVAAWSTAHVVVCSCSVYTENEERLFKSAVNAAKCTDRKPQACRQLC